jgi:hypothetical protein
LKYEAKTLYIFFRKISQYINCGYYRYALRSIPKNKDPKVIDEKLLKVYEVTYDRTRRMRNLKKGQANVVYVRFSYCFILLATEGFNEAFNKIDSKDFRTTPLHFVGYSVGVRNQKNCVLIAPQRMKRLKEFGLKISLHNEKRLMSLFKKVAPYPISGIMKQKQKLLSEINKKRKTAGLKPIKYFLNYKDSTTEA